LYQTSGKVRFPMCEIITAVDLLVF